MPEGIGYPKGDAILGKIKQGEFGADVAKRPNEKLNMNPNQKRYFIDNGKNHSNRTIAKFYWGRNSSFSILG